MFRSVRSRIVISFLIALVLIVGSTSAVTFGYVYRLVSGKTNSDGVAAATSCAAVFDLIGDEGYNLEDPEVYNRYRTTLRNICRDSGMKYLYAYRCDAEKNEATYLMCVAGDDAEDASIAASLGYGANEQREPTESELRALQGDPTDMAIEYDNDYGHTFDWVVRVNGWDGKVLAGASYPVDLQGARVAQNMVIILVPFVAATLVIFAVQMVVMWRYVFDPIRAIAKRMREFSPEHAGEFEPLDVRQNDEMREIADAFGQMAGDISEYVDSIERLTKERLQASVEVDVARRIQLGVVPDRTELGGDGFDVVALSHAARAVGGDFYDVLQLDDGRVAVVVGDSSGKGIAAALFMVMVKTMIHEGLMTGGGPAAVLNDVNARLCESNPEGMFVTVFACVLDPATGEVRYANAGHTLPFVVGDGLRVVDADPGTLLGLFDDVELEEGALSLGWGESLLIYTDGATEAVNAERKFLGDAAFAERIADGAPYAAAGDLVDSAVRAVEDFAAGCEQFDDLTVTALMRRQASILPVGAVAVAPEIDSVSAMHDAIRATDHDDKLKNKACLALEEAFVNVASYSGARRAWYAIEDMDGGIRLTIIDDGAPFDPTTAPSPDREFEELDRGGMGIGLVRQLASDVRYRFEGGCNVLVIEISG